MSARIEIDMGLNATGVARGAKDAEKAIKDLEDAVGDVGSESSTAGRQVDSFADKVAKAAREAGKSDDEIKDALRGYGVNAKEAQRAIDGIGDEFTDAAREGDRALDKLEDSLKKVQREADDTDDKVGKIGGKGFAKAGEAASEFKDEALQNLSEVTSSFDGSMESIGDLVQGTLGGVASSIPGIGLAAAGAAAGVGIITEAFNKVQEAADEARDSAFAMAYDVSGALESAGYSARITEWTSDTEKFKQVRDLATVAGWDEVDVLDALASGGDKLNDLTRDYAEIGATNADAQAMQSQRLWELEAVLKATSEGYLTGAQSAELAASSLYNFATQAGTATGEVDELGNAIYVLPDDTKVVINAATQKAYENVNQFETEVNDLPDSHTTTLNAVTSGLDAARNEVNRFISQNDGRSFRLHGRVTVDSGWDS